MPIPTRWSSSAARTAGSISRWNACEPAPTTSWPSRLRQRCSPPAAACPLAAGPRNLGVLWVLRSHRRRPYDGRDLERGAVFAAQAGLALDNRRLVSELEGRIEAMQEARRRLYTSARLEGVGR